MSSSSAPAGDTSVSDFERRISDQKSQHSCLRRLDEFMFCMSLPNQVVYYYRDGTYNDCRQHFHRWQNCLRSKMKKNEEFEERMRAEREKTHTGQHVFLFRPEYAAEANQRYGIPLAAPQREATLSS